MPGFLGVVGICSSRFGSSTPPSLSPAWPFHSTPFPKLPCPFHPHWQVLENTLISVQLCRSGHWNQTMLLWNIKRFDHTTDLSVKRVATATGSCEHLITVGGDWLHKSNRDKQQKRMDCENLLLALFVATGSGGQLILKNKLAQRGDVMASHLKLSTTHSLDPHIHIVARF